MSTFDTFVFDRQGTGKGSVLFTPQRCGSSFTKKILEHLPPEKRKGLHRVETPQGLLKDKMFQPFNWKPDEGTSWWHSGINYSELHIPPRAITHTVYRDPLVRYASGLAFLMTNWEDILLGPMQENLDYTREEDRHFVQKVCVLLGWNPKKYMSDNEMRHSSFYLHWKHTAVHSAKTIAKMQISPDPIFDFSYNESHMDPTMVKSALISTMFESSYFVLLEEYSEWLQNNVVTERYFDNLSGEDDITKWKVGRLGVTDSSQMSELHELQLKTIMREHFEVFENQNNFNYLNFDQWITPERQVYNFVCEHNGQFGRLAQRQMLIDFLIQMCEEVPHLFVRNKRLLGWVANEHVLKRLPAELAEAIKRNIGKGVRQLEKNRPLKWSEWAKW